MYGLGGGSVWRPTPLEKGFENRYNVSRPAQRKNNRPITLIGMVLGRVEKCLKKVKKKIFFVLKKYQSVTHISTYNFKGFSKI